MASQFTGLQSAFIDAYVGEAKFNTTEAARLAGYKGNGNTLAQVGYENLRKPDIAREIKARLEARAMTSAELLMRWGDQARVDVAAYYDGNGQFQLDKFKRDGHGHLIKSIKKDKAGHLIIEFIDKLASQKLIAQNLGMLIDKSEVTEIDGGSLVNFEEWKREQNKREDEAGETLEQFEKEE